MSHRTTLLSTPGLWVRALVLLVASTMLVTVAAPAAHADSESTIICHANRHDDDPYQVITVGGSSAEDTGGHKQHADNPPMTWKADGSWNGIPHKAGDAKPDYIEGYNDGGLDITEAFCLAQIDTDPLASIDLEKYVAVAADASGDCGGEGWTQDLPTTTGEGIRWCLKVTNDGVDALEQVTVVDDLAPDGGCELASELGAGDSDECSYDDTAEEGQHTNQAEATARGVVSGSLVSDTAEASYTADDPTPGVNLEKYVASGDKPGEDCGVGDAWASHVDVTTGDSIHWCLLVSNEGSDDLDDVTVSDALDDATAAEVCAADFDTLAAGEDAECTYSGTADQGTHTNRASVTATGVVTGSAVDDGADASYTAEDPAANITLKKFVARGDLPTEDCGLGDAWHAEQVFATTGDDIHWCLKVTNDGEDTLEDIEAFDELDNSSPESAAGCQLRASLAAGESDDCTYTDEAETGEHINYAEATAVGAISGDPVTDDANARYIASDAPIPAVALEKFVADGELLRGDPPSGCDLESGWQDHVEVMDGDQIFWCVEVTNVGTEELVDIAVYDGLDADSLTDEDRVACQLASELAVGASTDCWYTDSAIDGEHTNFAEVTATGASAEIGISTFGAMRTASAAPAGGTVTATAFASYFGHTLAPDASVSDPCAADGISLTLDNTSSSLAVTFEGTDALNGDAVLSTETVAGGDDLVVPVTVAEDADYDIDVTAVRASDGTPAGTWNFAGTRDCVTPAGTGGAGGGGRTPPTVTPDTDTDPVLVPGITLDKSASGDEFTVGDTVTYTYVITNTGETTLTSVQLTDDVLGSLTDLLGARTLDPGESITVDAMQTLVADDAGALTNTGTAAGFGPGSERVTTTDTVTVDVAAVLGEVIEAPAPAPAPPASEPEPVPAPDPAPVPEPLPAVEPAPEVRTETEELPRTGVSSTLLATLAAAMLAAGALLLGRQPPTVRH